MKKSLIYYCYVDDTFAVSENKEDCERFPSSFNSLRSSLCFMFEKELISSFLFLDILVEKHKTEFITFVYRKLTLTSQYF